MSRNSRARALAALVATLTAGCGHDYQRWAPTHDDLQELERLAVAENQPVDEMHRVGQRLDAILKDSEQPGPDLQQSSKTTKAEARLAAFSAIDPEDPLFLSRYFDLFKVHAASELRTGTDDRKQVAALNKKRLQLMYEPERAAIEAIHRDPRFGIALSGGGIRSACFSAGVLEGLHQIGLLDQAGYLSTVSGGGYIGGWYMEHHDVPDAELFDPAGVHLRHVTQNGFYLTQANFSSGIGPLLWDIFVDLFHVPLHWGCNGVFDFDVNTIGFRDDYRQGIASSFLYEDPMSPGDVKDSAYCSMTNLLPSNSVNRPYWIINCHLAMNNESGGYRARSGSPFEIAPIRCGSDIVGYVATEPAACAASTDPGLRSYLAPLWNPSDNERFWMTPAYAIAASGAAADSSSLKLHPALNYVLQLINADLGYYIAGWSRGWVAGDPTAVKSDAAFYTFTLDIPLLVGSYDVAKAVRSFAGWLAFWSDPSPDDANMDGHPQRIDAKKFYLTDGGHFEDLGAYALVKRGCRVIVIADGGMDSYANDWMHPGDDQELRRAGAFDDLRLLEARLYADFGAHLEIEWSRFDPRPDGHSDFGTGPTSTVFLGVIRNLPVEDGRCTDTCVIVYVKAAYDIDERLRDSQTFIDVEKRDEPTFPNENTAHQFYTENKVLAYRALAREMVLRNRSLLQAAVGRKLNGCCSFEAMRKLSEPCPQR